VDTGSEHIRKEMEISLQAGEIIKESPASAGLSQGEIIKKKI